jgi:uncharacterized protein with ParB-like and HNH nuclease domain
MVNYMKNSKKSGFNAPIAIKDLIEHVHKNDYLLPEIQREFVWKPEQVLKLFDSLMLDYPIGTFIFWKPKKTNVSDLKFYEFIKSFSQHEDVPNEESTSIGDNVTAVIDGQQRITALYIGLRSTYAYKTSRKKRTSHDAYPKRRLYLELLNGSQNKELAYPFSFFSEDEFESKNKEENKHWISLKTVYEMGSRHEINSYLSENKIRNKKSKKRLLALYNLINKNKVISYYNLETYTDLDPIFKIFERLNSAGTELSNSDVLFSKVIKTWSGSKSKINELLDDLNNKAFSFDKDFILKSSLMLSDLDIEFKRTSFSDDGINKIKSNWNGIKRSLIAVVSLVSSFGYNKENLPSNNAIMPIAYYLYKTGNSETTVESSRFNEDRKKIQDWLRRVLIKRAFSGQSDNALALAKKTIQKTGGGFPLSELEKEFEGIGKSIRFNPNQVWGLLQHKKDDKHTFSIISLLYQNLDFSNKFDIDHIFPKSKFTKSRLTQIGIEDKYIEKYIQNYDWIGNLQLLGEVPNRVDKNDKEPKEWLEHAYPDKTERERYLTQNYFPESIEPVFPKFLKFFDKRQIKMYHRLCELLIKS